jgi:molecular chaperone GrpE
MSNKARHHDHKHSTHETANDNQRNMTSSEEKNSVIKKSANSQEEHSANQTISADGPDLSKVQEERDKYLDLLRRTQAEFENYQKRASREAETERKFCQRPLALEIIPALDNLDRFLSTVKEETDLTKVVATVQKQLLEGLSRQGIKRIDPNHEQAILEQPSDQDPGTVLIEVEAGYLYHDRVLRPAKVIVAKSA